MRVILFALLTFLCFTCHQKQKKEVQHNFSTADAAFKYLIDSIGLAKDKKENKNYVCRSEVKANGRKIKFITNYNYDFFYTKEGKITKDLDNISVSVYNSTNQLKYYFVTSYGEHGSSKFIYNSSKQLIKIITWDDMNPSNVSRISSIEQFNYNLNQDSVEVLSNLYTGFAKDSKYKYAYDKKSNLIHNNAYPSIKLKLDDTQIREKLFCLSEDIWSYWKTHVTYH
jgi:hypothetical protein